jgi:TatA/E family protein of Tat protein translocase
LRPAAEVIMMGLSAVHMLIFGIVAVLLFGNRLPAVVESLRQSLREFRSGMRELQDRISNRDQQRGRVMREHFKKFLWTSKFWALLGLIGCVSGLYFQRVAANGSGLWCLGLMFLGAAYLEQQE